MMSKCECAGSANLPPGFQVIGPHNFDLYVKWYAAANAEPEVRRFLSGSGWDQPIPEAPKDDWAKQIIVSDRTLITLSFDRSACSEISVGLWTLGENKKLASGRALLALLWALRRYQYFRRVRSGCKMCNTASYALHKHVMGEPWGIEPQGVFDEVTGFCDQAHFSAPLDEVLKKFAHVGAEVEVANV